MSSPLADLARYMGSPEGRRIVLYRDDNELHFLETWLKGNDVPGDKPLNVHETVPDLLVECNRCPSALGRKKASGSGVNGVMVLLNAPSMLQRGEMDLLRRESAQLLKKMIEAIGLRIEDCYLTNLIKCDSSDPVVRPSDMLVNCMEVFRQELDHVKPRIVIVMGDIKIIQRTVNESRDVHWFAIHHPVTIVKNPELKRQAWNTLQLAMEKLREQ